MLPPISNILPVFLATICNDVITTTTTTTSIVAINTNIDVVGSRRRCSGVAGEGGLLDEMQARLIKGAHMVQLPGELLVVVEGGLLQLAVDQQLFFLAGQGRYLASTAATPSIVIL